MSPRNLAWANVTALALIVQMIANLEEAAGEPTMAADSYVLDHEAKRIDGTNESLDHYEGKVILIVNVASECGLTPQYESLERLYRERKDEGFVILGFPANNFGGQEPGSNEEIAEFCSTRFDVSFPMFEKVSVLGDDRHPLYADLASQPAPTGEPPTWNFTKYLVGRDGRVVKRFGPRTTPDDKELLEEIEQLIGEPAEK